MAQTLSSAATLTVTPCEQMYGAEAVVLPTHLAHALAAREEEMHDLWRGDTLAVAVAACDPWRFLSRSDAFIGLHVLCALRSDRVDGRGAADALAIFADGLWSSLPSAILPWDAPADVPELLLLVQHELSLPRRAAHLQPAGVFTADGQRLRSLAELRTSRSAPLLLYEGGQWIWPPISLHHTWTVYGNGHAVSGAHADGAPAVADAAGGERVAMTLVTVSMKPVAFEVRDFLRGDEAAHMQSKASPHMFASGVANIDADRGKQMDGVRTSTMTFLHMDHDARLKAVARRVQCLTRVGATHDEAVQVLRYQPLQHYQAHHDFFDPEFYQQQPGMLQQLQHGANNRLATVFMYLTNVTSGGATAFPRARGDAVPADKVLDCSLGVAVRPEANKVRTRCGCARHGHARHYII